MPPTPDLHELNWNLLRSFYVIAEEKSLTKAAKRLDMSQPSVSLALQKLEEQLACQLIFRGSRHFSLTLVGERIFRECSEIFRAVERITALAPEQSDELFGEIHLSIISHLRSRLIDEAIRVFHQRYPSITWRIEMQNSAETVRKISSEKTGIGICLLTKPIVNLTCKHLFREEFSIYCGHEHHLYGKAEVSIKDLQQEPFVAFACATEGMGLEPMMMLREGIQLGKRVSGSSQDLEEVQRMIVAGLGIGILPTIIGTGTEARKNLWPLTISDYSLGADVFMVSAPESRLSVPEQKFLSLIDELMVLYPEIAQEAM